jgi:hypothetical protein
MMDPRGPSYISFGAELDEDGARLLAVVLEIRPEFGTVVTMFIRAGFFTGVVLDFFLLVCLSDVSVFRGAFFRRT